MSVYIRRDHWTPTEDKIVQAAVMKYGTNQWSRVASLLVRKSAVQCKARWHEHLTPQLSKQEWSRREDKMLFTLERAMPNMWRSIGATLGGRTAAQAFDRWTYLNENSESTQKLLEDVELDESEASELDSDSEKQVMAEAKARLSNSLGKKANRKQRERLEDETAFNNSIADHRRAGTAIKVKQSKFSIDYNRSVPYEILPVVDEKESAFFGASSRRKSTQRRSMERAPRKPGRPKMELPSPIASSNITSPPSVTALGRQCVHEKLASLPPPLTHNTLITLALQSQSDEISDVDSEDQIEANDLSAASLEEVSLEEVSFDAVLSAHDGELEISADARSLLDAEISRVKIPQEQEVPKLTRQEVYEKLVPVTRKYDSLKQSLIDSAKGQTRLAT